MVQYLYDKNIILYTLAGLCGLGLLIRLIVDLVYNHLVKESDNLGETKNKMLKHIKMKFETCYKLKIGVNNVDTFVDKNVLRYRFCGLLLSTWDNLGGQVLFLNLLIVPVCAVFGVAEDCGQDQVLFMGAVGILTSAVLIIVDKSINLTSKKRMLRLNLLDYLENFCKVRLEKETFQPEVFEQYKREYLQASEANKQISATVAPKEKQDPKEEMNRRREARRKKEEERKLQAAKREEEQRKIEEARREEEKRRAEERRLMAARRREEERLKLEEEREALEARRAEAKRKAEEKLAAIDRKHQEVKEKEKVLQSVEKDLLPKEDSSMDKLMMGVDEIAAEKEQTVLLKDEIEVKGKAEKDRFEKERFEKERLEKERLENDKLEIERLEKDRLTKENAELAKSEKEASEKEIIDKVDHKEEINKVEKEASNKDKQKKVAVIPNKFQGVSPQEEKLIEDVLKEFFA